MISSACILKNVFFLIVSNNVVIEILCSIIQHFSMGSRDRGGLSRCPPGPASVSTASN